MTFLKTAFTALRFLPLLLSPALCAAAEPVIKVACIGDSITAGFGIPKDRLTYPQQLAEKLGPRYEVGNFGATGRALLKSSNAPYLRTKTWAEAQAFLPDIAVVVLGTNDSKPKNFVRIDEFVADATDLIRTLQSLPTKPRIFIGLPPPVYRTAFTINEENMVRIRDLLATVSVREKLPVIDLFGKLSGQPRLFGDGVHPNAVGVELLADAVFKAIAAPAAVKR